MTNIAVLGNQGMLGWMVERVLGKFEKFNVCGFNRSQLEITSWSDDFVNLYTLLGEDYDYIINCIGAIKPMFNDATKTPLNIKINSLFPWSLADYGDNTNTRVIHITTDCVFDGATGGYTEESPHNPTDAYGKTKSLGEPDNCMVLRTSIIGAELPGRNRSLVEWLISQDGKEVNGFTNHLWNGMTTTELANLVAKIINRDFYRLGTFHLYSNSINKCELLRLLVGSLGLDIKVNPTSANTYCDRTLSTTKSLNSLLGPQSLENQIKTMILNESFNV